MEQINTRVRKGSTSANFWIFPFQIAFRILDDAVNSKFLFKSQHHSASCIEVLTLKYPAQFIYHFIWSLHMSQVAHQARAYPGYYYMKWLGVFLLLTGQDASPSQGYTQR